MSTEKPSHLQTSRRGFITNLASSRKGFVTNYPNFQHWRKTTAEEIFAAKPLNIYVHIPFCAQQCAYCYYRTITGSRKSEIDRYVDALCREIDLATRRFHLGERPVISVYFGGGTPTLISGENLSKITETLHRNLNIADDCEFTVEGEPVTLIQKKADTLKELGVNRISLGVQSLCDDVIKLSNRQDTEKKVLRAIQIAKNTGAIVNIDLMSGLAGETSETWAYTIARVLETDVESITVYKTELYANTQYFKDARNNKLELPSDEQELEFMRYALEQFEPARYLPWCFFTFTKEGRYEHIHAPSIWRGEDYFPFGTSAFGRLGDWLFQNTNEVEKYVSLVEADESPIHRGHCMTSMDKMVRDVVLGMKLINLDLKQFREKYGFSLDSFCASTIAELESDGFLSRSEDEIRLTSKGILHGDYVGKSLGKSLMESQPC
uniref:Heme chaperone HemW n=1 Tax=Candidatus Kentrum sp. FW TaxID=2126338 RepID=A0A450SFX1_9GAMM|nr:MAG: oxygen-independent coproporphyrinogen-3 oxidase [Candidatus Kentron sp. FW]VFJ51833.1 MAG: oxygen-independent coproporphyrinogen-3 oxidase [Candidatus Kentron sp. FW]